MVDPSELKHEVALPTDFPLVKLYRFCWGKNATLDFCHLFWGMLFFWLPPLVVVICAPIYFGLVVPGRRVREKCEAHDARVEAERATRPPKERTWLLDKIVNASARFVMFLRFTVKPFWRAHLSRPLLFAARAILIVGVAGALLYGLYALIFDVLMTLSASTWGTLGLFILCTVGGAVLGTLLVVASVLLYDKAHERALDLAKRPVLGSFKVLGIGYRAVKTNTCPRIRVYDPKTGKDI